VRWLCGRRNVAHRAVPLLKSLEERVEVEVNHDDVRQQLVAMFSLLEKNDSEVISSGRRELTSHATREAFGFSLVKRKSSLGPLAGHGLVLEGKISKGRVVCMYPGLIYLPGEPVAFCSFRNNFILRRNDGASLDGKPYGLSRYMYKSIASREGLNACDISWLESKEEDPNPANPFALGHLINHNSPANVMYFEHDFPRDFPEHLWHWIPNIYYGGSAGVLKGIVLITLRDVYGEELFTNYQFIGTNDIRIA